MKTELIKDLEALLKEKDPDKIKRIRESINLNSAADTKEVMNSVNTFSDTQSPESREAIERLIKEHKEASDDEMK